ncbi:MAG: hypothetical protein J0I70_08365 [Microbacterium sp.]|uniref:hypothetical protein n=1 Tax=Microbacterium sp. TaxID=51671 RepID=UPI001AD4E6E8|nr:hypothetical protein [Microbacterium sp.]MBN9174152.1 hypothetical protein [Microbacterium sp.]MBN9188310.1 hypothetical protein [Microbacterium sp.]MBN9194345.1 hypothetical protein [Microbacterium sp.]
MKSYSVRAIFRHGRVYEERLVLHFALSAADALRLAEREAHEYADALGNCEYLGLLQAYELPNGRLEEGSELFSLLRESDLEAADYLTSFFDTGHELQDEDVDVDSSD